MWLDCVTGLTYTIKETVNKGPNIHTQKFFSLKYNLGHLEKTQQKTIRSSFPMQPYLYYNPTIWRWALREE